MADDHRVFSLIKPEDLPSGTPSVANGSEIDRLRPQREGRGWHGSAFLLGPGTIQDYVVAARAYWVPPLLVYRDA
ncbi:hypothetical protein SUDANB95_00483 [Actinosynnema sp. ALI-1.44]